jgi:hypothetical protein
MVVFLSKDWKLNVEPHPFLLITKPMQRRNQSPQKDAKLMP